MHTHRTIRRDFHASASFSCFDKDDVGLVAGLFAGGNTEPRAEVIAAFALQRGPYVLSTKSPSANEVETDTRNGSLT